MTTQLVKNNTRKTNSRVSKILAFTFVSIILIANAPAFAEQTVTLVGDPWPPFVEGKLGEDASSGVAVEIVNEIFSRIDGAEVRFPLIPWNRALREVEDGTSDGIVILLKNRERERYMVFSEPLLVGENLFWSASDNTIPAFEWKDLGDLKGLKVGVTEGYSNGAQLDRSIENGEIEAVSAPAVENLFTMLAYGRIDVAVATNVVGYALARKYPESGIKPASRPVNTEIFHLGISKKSTAVKLIPEINQAIQSLRAEGYIQKILQGE